MVNAVYTVLMKRNAPRLTIEIDSKLRQRFWKRAVANDTTMRDLIIAWIEDYLR